MNVKNMVIVVIDEIQKRIIEAMKDKNKGLVLVLRDIKDKLTQAEKEKKGELTETDCINVLNKMAKIRKHSIDMYKKSTRKDLLEKEQFELGIIEEYLPKQMNTEDIKSNVMQIIIENKYSNVKDTKKVKQEFDKTHSGQDGKTVSDVIKTILLNMTH